MAKYKIKENVSSVAARNKVIRTEKDGFGPFDAAHFGGEDAAKDLENRGFLKEVKEEKKQGPPKQPEKGSGKKKADDMTRDEIAKILEENGAEVGSKESKKDLYERYLDL